MKEKLLSIARSAGEAAASAASKTSDYIVTHKPTEQDVDRAKGLARKAGAAISQETLSLGKELVRSKTFKDAAKGAGVGAVVAVPVPLIGPAVGAVLGAAAGVVLGRGSQPQPAVLQNDQRTTVVEVVAEAHKDLYEELTKLDELRQKGILTEEEFSSEKQKLLDKR